VGRPAFLFTHASRTLAPTFSCFFALLSHPPLPSVSRRSFLKPAKQPTCSRFIVGLRPVLTIERHTRPDAAFPDKCLGLLISQHHFRGVFARTVVAARPFAPFSLALCRPTVSPPSLVFFFFRSFRAHASIRQYFGVLWVTSSFFIFSAEIESARPAPRTSSRRSVFRSVR